MRFLILFLLLIESRPGREPLAMTAASSWERRVRASPAVLTQRRQWQYVEYIGQASGKTGDRDAFKRLFADASKRLFDVKHMRPA
jgi:hypothetical protein